MKAIILLGFFTLLLVVPLCAADSTDVLSSEEEIVITEEDNGEQYDFFIDKDGDGICDNRTLRNKGIISKNKNIRHYRMISYKYNYQYKCEFGSAGGSRRGEGANGQHGSHGHHGGQ